MGDWGGRVVIVEKLRVPGKRGGEGGENDGIARGKERIPFSALLIMNTFLYFLSVFFSFHFSPPPFPPSHPILSPHTPVAFPKKAQDLHELRGMWRQETGKWGRGMWEAGNVER